MCVFGTNRHGADYQRQNKETDEGTGCYVVKVNSTMEGTLTQTISGNPVSGTYSLGQDLAGTYKAVVYFTAISK